MYIGDLLKELTSSTGIRCVQPRLLQPLNELRGHRWKEEHDWMLWLGRKGHTCDHVAEPKLVSLFIACLPLPKPHKITMCNAPPQRYSQLHSSGGSAACQHWPHSCPAASSMSARAQIGVMHIGGADRMEMFDSTTNTVCRMQNAASSWIRYSCC